MTFSREWLSRGAAGVRYLRDTATVMDGCRLASYFCRNALHKAGGHFMIPGSNRSVRMKGGWVVFGDCRSELGAYGEVFQDKSYERIPAFIPRPDWTVLDVGASIGLFCLRNAPRTSRGRVYAFEPNEESYSRLLENIRLNRLANVSALNAAVGSTDGQGFLEVDPTSFTSGKMRMDIPRDRSKGSHTTNVLTIDAFAERNVIDHIHLLKVDVEGAELEVLRGARRTLPKVGRIVLEYHSLALLSGIRDFLTACDFREEGVFPSGRVWGIVYFSRDEVAGLRDSSGGTP